LASATYGEKMPAFRRSSVWSFLRVLLLIGLSAGLSSARVHARDESASLSSKDRSRLFEQVWQLINEKYYDPSFGGTGWKAVRERYRARLAGIDRDDELYGLLKEMTGELHDAHTRFRSPEERRRADKLQATSPGIGIGEVDDMPVVITVEPGSEADQMGVGPGMIVASVDGAPFSQRLAHAQEETGNSSSARATALLSYDYIFAGEPESKIRLGLQREDGSTFEVTLTRHVVALAPQISVRVLPSGYAYLKFGLFNAEVAKHFKEALAKVKKSPGVVLDLRGNPGGDFDGMLQIASDFFPERVSFGKVISRSGKRPSLMLRILGVPSELEVGSSVEQAYSGPLVILVNNGSGSSAELFAAGMKENRRAAIVGRQTCGCVLASIAHRVRGGGEVDISEFAIVTAKGHKLEGTGVVPDVTVPLTLYDLRSHRDAALQQAVMILNKAATHSRLW
jgi:carboxyl-terminal processing protease